MGGEKKGVLLNKILILTCVRNHRSFPIFSFSSPPGPPTPPGNPSSEPLQRPPPPVMLPGPPQGLRARRLRRRLRGTLPLCTRTVHPWMAGALYGLLKCMQSVGGLSEGSASPGEKRAPSPTPRGGCGAGLPQEVWPSGGEGAGSRGLRSPLLRPVPWGHDLPRSSPHPRP